MGGSLEKCVQTRQIARGTFFQAELSGAFLCFLLTLHFPGKTRETNHTYFRRFWGDWLLRARAPSIRFGLKVLVARARGQHFCSNLD